MDKINKKVLFLTIVGLGAVLLAVFITPSFATKYLDSDQNITPAGLRKLGLFRLISASSGTFIFIYITLTEFVGLQRLKAFQRWQASALGNVKILVPTILIAGSILRLIHLPFVGLDSPFRLGGLFLEFAYQISENGFLLPENIPFYTEGGIPYAYPPLPFYVEALSVYVLGIKPFAVVNILPPFISIVSLLSFYHLTREADLNKWSQVGALAAFGFMPNAFEKQIEGAGLSESFGTLALIWLFIAFFRAFKSNTRTNHLLVGLFWAVCVTSSPGSAYASVPLFLIFSVGMLIRYKKTLNTALDLSLAAGLAGLLSSPYWVTVLGNHGLSLFLDSVGGQYAGFSETIKWTIQTLLEFKFISGPYTTIWNILLFSGIVIAFLHKRFALILWLFILVVIPREGVWMLSIPSALLIGMNTEVINRIQSNRNAFKLKERDNIILNSGLLLIFIWLAIGPFMIAKNNVVSTDSTINPKTFEAIGWMQMNTPPESRVVGITKPLVLEWLPHLSRRVVVNVWYGSEWQPDELAPIETFRREVGNCENMDCILALSQEIVDQDQFILFIERSKYDPLTTDQNKNAAFDLLWENDEIVIGELFE